MASVKASTTKTAATNQRRSAPSRRASKVPTLFLRRRVMTLVILLLSMMTVVLFGLAIFNAWIIQNQDRLNETEGLIADALDENLSLKYEEAQLISPTNINSKAQEELGLEPATTVIYLSPENG